MNRLSLFLLFILLLAVSAASADDFYESQLNSGIRNSEVSSYLLIQEARKDSVQAEALLNRASVYSPDLPAAYFEHARKKLSFRYADILSSIDYLIAGINAYGRNFWWSFSLAGSAVLGLVSSFIISVSVIALIRSVMDLPLLAHELGESGQNIMLLLGFIIISIISPLLLLAGLLILLGLYMSKIDRIVVYLFLVFLLAAPVVFNTASRFFNISSTGAIKAIVDVNEAKGNVYALTVLKSSNDPAALFSYALALKRVGLYDEAINIYDGLIKTRPEAASYVNLGNAHAGKNSNEEALKSYLAAVNIQPLASAYYNLSQISREMFDFDKGSEYFEKAVEVDRSAVAAYRAVYDRTPNRFVADEPFAWSDLWNLVWNMPSASATFSLMLLPGWTLSVAALLLMAAFFLLGRHARNKAYRCRRCQSIFCPKCEKHIMWGQMCPQCFSSLIKLEELEVRERVARLMSIYEHQKRRRDVMKWLSFILPGAPQIYAGKVLYGFLFMWPFMFFLIFPFAACVMEPDAYGSHWLFNAASLLTALVLLIFTNIFTRQRIAKGWL